MSHQSIITVGLDVGFGQTKAFMPGATPLCFPSICGYARTLKFKAEEIIRKYPGDLVYDNDGVPGWFVGDLALSQIPAGEQIKLRGRTVDEAAIGNIFRLRMVKTALGKLFPGLQGRDVLQFRIATGLPVNHMPDAPALKTALLGQHLILTDQTDFVADIVEVIVMPQPYGTIYSQILTRTGAINDCHAYTVTAVCDFGTYTIDLAVDNDGEYIEAQSGSIEAGAYLAQERIAQIIEREHRFSPDYKTIEGVLKTGCLSIRGKPKDYKREVELALEPVAAAAINLLNNRLHATDALLDVMYLVGGLAPRMADGITQYYPQAKLLADSQFTNVFGYVNYALFQANASDTSE